MSDLTAVQIVLFIFAFALLVFCFYLIVKPPRNSIPLVTSFSAYLVITLFAGFGPSSVSKMVYKKGEFSLIRHIPSESDIRDSLVASADDLDSTATNIEKRKNEAEQRSDLQRSDDDYLVLATDAWRSKDYDSALQYAFKGLSLPSSDTRVEATLIHRVGSIYVGMGNTALGLTKYHEALSVDPQFSWPHVNLGNAYLEQGNVEEAIAEYKEATRLDPNNEKFRINLAVAEKRAK